MGEAVKLIQSLLSKLGFDIGKCGEDGLFGPKTKKALEDFQESLGLTISSSIDGKTLEKLYQSHENPALENFNKALLNYMPR